jgi:hypothetical protein
MRFLDEHRRRPAAPADHLPWAALVAPGVVLNKDGSFLPAFRFRGPDLESATEDELMAVRARLNNALKRLGSGWCLHVEARVDAPPSPIRRAPSTSTRPGCSTPNGVAASRARTRPSRPISELALTWLPPADRDPSTGALAVRRGSIRPDRTGALPWAFSNARRRTTFDLLADALPEIDALDDRRIC